MEGVEYCWLHHLWILTSRDSNRVASILHEAWFTTEFLSPLCYKNRAHCSLLQCLHITTAILSSAHSYFVVSFKCVGKNSCHDLIPKPPQTLYLNPVHERVSLKCIFVCCCKEEREICNWWCYYRYLIEQGANVAAVNNDAELPLDIAESDEMEDMLQQNINAQGIRFFFFFNFHLS